MNINFTLINEFLSFLIFFVFSFIFIFPKIINIINYNDLNDFKNKIFLNYNKTLENNLIKKIFIIEFEIQKQFDKNIKNINNNILKKKNFLLDIIILEKNFFIKKIKKIFNLINYNYIKNFYNELKINFVQIFKKIFNNIINYNKEFIII
ncbi:hypothetical protein CUN91_00495 [Candidatus Carsonella ruddii]|uniref:Uncharacterized protein n=1 Tax=Carsonella ruddii TaxID=114186 RepID=A0A2K8K5V2_CARRU|nr:hypothetical protein [Candidatus Carsonella ruddii]ATX33434.1 hypothetical protein CUN91_00495 [Candidatus Carsonella ruddii]